MVDQPCEMCEVLAFRPGQVMVSDDVVIAVPVRTRVPGNLVVVPTAHVASFDALPLPMAARLLTAASTAARLSAEQNRPDGLNTWIDSGAITGETWGHIAVEVAPRFREVPYVFVERTSLTESPADEVDAVAAAYRALLHELPGEEHDDVPSVLGSGRTVL